MLMVSEGSDQLSENDELKGDELSGSGCLPAVNFTYYTLLFKKKKITSMCSKYKKNPLSA